MHVSERLKNEVPGNNNEHRPSSLSVVVTLPKLYRANGASVINDYLKMVPSGMVSKVSRFLQEKKLSLLSGYHNSGQDDEDFIGETEESGRNRRRSRSKNDKTQKHQRREATDDGEPRKRSHSKEHLETEPEPPRKRRKVVHGRGDCERKKSLHHLYVGKRKSSEQDGEEHYSSLRKPYKRRGRKIQTDYSTKIQTDYGTESIYLNAETQTDLYVFKSTSCFKNANIASQHSQITCNNIATPSCYGPQKLPSNELNSMTISFPTAITPFIKYNFS